MLTSNRTGAILASPICDLLDICCDSFDILQDTIETQWLSPNCRCGCSGYDTHSADFPLRYLWMSNADIHTEEAAKKAAKEEAERQEKIRVARLNVEQAKMRVTQAQTEAAQKLERAMEDLAAIEKEG